MLILPLTPLILKRRFPVSDLPVIVKPTALKLGQEQGDIGICVHVDDSLTRFQGFNVSNKLVLIGQSSEALVLGMKRRDLKVTLPSAMKWDWVMGPFLSLVMDL